VIGLWFAGQFGNGRGRLVQWRRRSRGLEVRGRHEGGYVALCCLIKG